MTIGSKQSSCWFSKPGFSFDQLVAKVLPPEGGGSYGSKVAASGPFLVPLSY